MAGYHNYSMSNNAVRAYAEGLLPLSKWTKSAILAAAQEYLEEAEDPQAEEKLAMLRKCKLATLKKHVLVYKEWHHTSSHYNETSFYGVDSWTLDNLTAEDVDVWNEPADHTTQPATPTRRKGSIDYIIWGGTRKHPKAIERRMENVDIEEKGSFYIVYSNGEQVLKKKIGSNGTHVTYSN